MIAELLKSKPQKINALLVTFVFFICIMIGVSGISSIMIFPEQYHYYLSGILAVAFVLILINVFLKVEGISFESIGITWEKLTPVRFLIGFLAGVIIVGTMMICVVNLGYLEVSYAEDYNVFQFLFWSMAFLPLAIFEELAFRSFSFLKLNKKYGLRITQIVMAILFALYHDISGHTFVNQLLGPGIWALVYGMAAFVSKGIALPTGIHMAANFVQASFGMKNTASIWILSYPDNTSEHMMQYTEQIGLSLQLIILVISIIWMELYLRTKSKI